ncbi:MAG: 3-methyl-2-oxobutanoate hydroxymethyltransferase [Geminicoccaceae bacterium]
MTWTGWRAVGKTADEAMALWRHTQKLEEIGVFGAELEVVPDRVAKFLSENSSLVMLGMGAGRYADAQYLFTEDVCGYGRNHKPRHGKVYRNFGARVRAPAGRAHRRLQGVPLGRGHGRVSEAAHTVAIADDAFEAFLAQAGG